MIHYFLTFFSCYTYKEILLFLLIKSHNNSSVKDFYFIFTCVTEVFSVYLDILFFISFQFFLVYTVYNIFIFFLPALFIYEYNFLKFILKFLTLVMVCFIFGCVNFFIPYTWNFFMNFHIFLSGQPFYFEAKLAEYLNFYISMYNLCLIVSLFFFFFFFFQSFYLKLESVEKYRKVYYYFFIITASLMTPPEVSSQLFISLILILIYELITFLIILIDLINDNLRRQPIKAR